MSNFTERKQSFVYNAQGRLTARNTEQAINLSGQTGTRRYSHRYRWDSRWGRLLGEAWPNGVGRGYHYDGVGRVILETGLGTNMPTVLRAVQEIDARGQVVKAELGDCVTGPCIAQERSYAPSTGQMLEQSYSIESPEGSRELHSERYRHDYLANLSQRERLSGTSIALKETYTYDALQRLRTSQVYSSGSLVNDVLLDYDAVGNLTKKSDYASTYTYPGVNEARPNAVTSTYGGPTGTLYYDYDASGNLIARSLDADLSNTNNRTFWARYNHNHQVIFSATRPSGGSTAWTAGSQYFYDAQNRLSRQVEGNDGASEHLIYLEGYEDRVGGYRTRSYVDDYAHLTRYRYGQLELRFVLTDRLGSVVSVVRADRDSGGYVTALEPETGLAYDVFGAPRHATTWAGLDANEAWPQATTPWDVVTPTTRHGFTGHEMLSKQRLIHMRGRLFDPRMGRFTGVDPVIQFPLSTQGLNPYSYLLNNPLAGTDPTGYRTCMMSDDKSCLEDGVNTVVDDKGNKSTVIVGQKGDNIAITGTMDVSNFKYISSDINLAFNPSNGADDWVKNGPKGSSDIGSASERGKGCAGNGPIQCYVGKSNRKGKVTAFERTFETSGGVGAVNGMLNNIGKALTLMSGHINRLLKFAPIPSATCR